MAKVAKFYNLLKLERAYGSHFHSDHHGGWKAVTIVEYRPETQLHAAVTYSSLSSFQRPLSSKAGIFDFIAEKNFSMNHYDAEFKFVEKIF